MTNFVGAAVLKDESMETKTPSPGGEYIAALKSNALLQAGTTAITQPPIEAAADTPANDVPLSENERLAIMEMLTSMKAEFASQFRTFQTDFRSMMQTSIHDNVINADDAAPATAAVAVTELEPIAVAIEIDADAAAPTATTAAVTTDVVAVLVHDKTMATQCIDSVKDATVVVQTPTPGTISPIEH